MYESGMVMGMAISEMIKKYTHFKNRWTINIIKVTVTFSIIYHPHLSKQNGFKSH